MAVITSTQTGNASAGSTWVGGVAPVDGDTAVIAAGHTVTQDVNRSYGSNASGVGHAVTVNGTSSSVFGTFQVASGVTLTLRGTNTTTNTLMLVNRFGQFLPLSGSTVVGDVAGDYTSIVLNKGIFSASGATFTSPSGAYSWSNQVTGEAWALGGNSYFDSPGRLGCQTTAKPCIANAAGTGIGSLGDSSLTFTAKTAGFFTNEVATPSLVLATGDYWVDYDTGLLLHYLASATPPTATVNYKYLTITKGWGVQTTTNTTYCSFSATNCTFNYMGGTSSANSAVYAFSRKTAGGGGDHQGFAFTGNTCRWTQRLMQIGSFTGSAGDYFLVEGNTFYTCLGTATPYTVFDNGVSSYVSVSNNTLNVYTLIAATGFGAVTNFANYKINGNTGRCAALVDATYPNMCVYPDSVISGNNLQGFAGANSHPCLESLGGTSGHPSVVSGNTFYAYYYCITASSYLTVAGNWFSADYHEFISPCLTQVMKITGVTVADNFFSGPTGPDYNAYGREASFVECGSSNPLWVDGWTVANNTMSQNPNGGFTLGNGISCHVTTVTKGEWRNNAILSAATQSSQSGFPGQGVQRTANGVSQPGLGIFARVSVQALELDYNGFYQDGCNYLGLSPGATFLRSGAKYNYDGTRGVTGVALHSPGYATPPAAKSLAYAINTAGADETLSWGGGTPVQMVFAHGTITSTATVSATGIQGLYTWTIADTGLPALTTDNRNTTTCPNGYFVKFTTGTLAGQVFMVASTVVASKTLTLVPGLATAALPAVGDAYTIYYPELTLADSAGSVTGYRVTNQGDGYTSNPTASLAGGTGGSGATAPTPVIAYTALASLTPGSPGSGYTAPPTVSFSGGGGSGAAALGLLGTVQAGVDPRSLPATSQTDTGITFTSNDVTTDPLVSNIAGTTPADYRIAAGSPLKRAGSSTSPTALDYFGTAFASPPSIGFAEAPAGGMLRRISMDGGMSRLTGGLD